MPENSIWMKSFPKAINFQLQDVSRILKENGYTYSDETIRKRLKQAVDNDELVKKGRNLYCTPEEKLSQYNYTYSHYAEEIAEILQKISPYLDFSLFELVQLNEFVNHLLAHNIVFVAVESDIADFIFDKLRENFPGKVLITPTVEQYHRYWTDNLIVITRLVSQRPTFKQNRWHTRLETLLVDLFANSILSGTISSSEYPAIFETAFNRYIINEKSLFRYAKRRTADKKIRQMIKEKTNIVLIAEEN